MWVSCIFFVTIDVKGKLELTCGIRWAFITAGSHNSNATLLGIRVTRALTGDFFSYLGLRGVRGEHLAVSIFISSVSESVFLVATAVTCVSIVAKVEVNG